MSDSKDAISSSLPIPLAVEDEGEEFWLNHLDEWDQSGLTQAAYCRVHNPDYRRFCKWKERLRIYPSARSAIKLVEVSRDFSLNVERPSPSSTFSQVEGVDCSSGYSWLPPDCSGVNRPGNFSGIRFWFGQFCIEIDVHFSSESLSQLIRTLQKLQKLQGLTNTNTNDGNAWSGGSGRNAGNAGGAGSAGGAGGGENA